MRWFCLVGALLVAGCAGTDNGCIGDPGTVCTFQMRLDMAKRWCTVYDMRDPREPVGSWSAAHGTATYCDREGWRNGR